MQRLVKWALAPLAIAGVAAGLGQLSRRSPFASSLAALSPAERSALETALPFSMANASWALGDVSAVRNMMRTELDRLPESEGPARSRVFVRFGLVDTNPDGQAAVFFQACASDPNVCSREQLKAAIEREIAVRFVAPGNQLPLYVIDGHPRVQTSP